MGLFHYLLVVSLPKTIDRDQISAFFIEKNFCVVENTAEVISMKRTSNCGEIEMLLDESSELSLRVGIASDVQIIDELVEILNAFIKKLDIKAKIYDVQNKVFVDTTNVKKIRSLYLKRKRKLKKYI